MRLLPDYEGAVCELVQPRGAEGRGGRRTGGGAEKAVSGQWGTGRGEVWKESRGGQREERGRTGAAAKKGSTSSKG